MTKKARSSTPSNGPDLPAPLGLTFTDLPNPTLWTDMRMNRKVFEYWLTCRSGAHPFKIIRSILNDEGVCEYIENDMGIGPRKTPGPWDKLMKALSAGKASQPRGRPRIAKEVRALAEHLVDYWESATGEKFTQDWHKGQPIASGTRFLHRMFKEIDPAALDRLPRISREIITARNRAACGK
jgi:hypothetical protein